MPGYAPSHNRTRTTVSRRIIAASFVTLQDVEYDGTIETIAAHIMIRNVGPPVRHRARGTPFAGVLTVAHNFVLCV